VLLFEVSYDGERMIGAGTLTIRVKISEFFSLAVDEGVDLLFGGAGFAVLERHETGSFVHRDGLKRVGSLELDLGGRFGGHGLFVRSHRRLPTFAKTWTRATRFASPAAVL